AQCVAVQQLLVDPRSGTAMRSTGCRLSRSVRAMRCARGSVAFNGITMGALDVLAIKPSSSICDREIRLPRFRVNDMTPPLTEIQLPQFFDWCMPGSWLEKQVQR